MTAQLSRQVQAETDKLRREAQQAIAAQVAAQMALFEQAAADAKLAEAAKQAEDRKQEAKWAWYDTITAMHSWVPRMWGPDVEVTPTLQMPAYTAAQPEDVNDDDLASAVTNAEACLPQDARHADLEGALGHYTQVRYPFPQQAGHRLQWTCD